MSISRRASSTVAVIGFSTITSQPASSSSRATSKCVVVGVATTAQSISRASAATESNRCSFSVCCDLGGDRVVRLDEAGDVRLRHLGQDARVQPAEVAGADDADARVIG